MWSVRERVAIWLVRVTRRWLGPKRQPCNLAEERRVDMLERLANAAEEDLR